MTTATALTTITRPQRRRREWLVPAGLIAALSGLWMAVFFPFAPDAGSALLVALRATFGSAMAVCIIRGFVAIRGRDFRRHGAWMTRAYALGSAAGTQAIVYAVWTLGVGPSDARTDAVLMGSAWAINAAVAELVIRRRSRRGGGGAASDRAVVA